ncbi:MAG: exodeoxyribonuclease V subunit gamma [Chlamydiales bacterium]|nr:exodeoxyribonuclease V subunit gamma [Chlamydiales bacterium]
MLEVLLSSCLSEKFSKEEIRGVLRFIKHAQIRFGLAGRDILGTWENGIDRLLLGMFMEIDHDSVLEVEGDLFPSEMGGAIDFTLFDRFIGWMRTLIIDLEPIIHSEKRSLHAWLVFLKEIIASHLDLPDRESFLDLDRLLVCFSEEEGPLLDSTVLDRILDSFCKKQTKALFTHDAQRIRFRNLQSGNVTQAKGICLLGMDEMSFPRKGFASSLCSMRGDPDFKKIPKTAEEDRYLLLETLTLAQEFLYLSYQRIDPQDGKERDLCLPLQELLKRFQADTKKASPSFEEISSPPFSIAKKSLIEKPKPFTLPEQTFIEISSLEKLAKDPIRFHCEETLRLKIPYDTPDEERFLLSPLFKAIFRKNILRSSGKLDFQERIQSQLKISQAAGKLPIGIFEKVAVSDLEEQMGLFEKALEVFSLRTEDFFSIEFSKLCTEPILADKNHWILPPCIVSSTEGPSFHLVGTIEGITPYGLLFQGQDKIPDWIRLWPLLLALGSLKNPPFPFDMQVLFLKDSKRKDGSFFKQSALGSDYLKYYRQAQELFVPFVPDWMPSLLHKSPIEFKKAIRQSLAPSKLENPYLQWLDKHQEGWDAEGIFSFWAPFAKQIFRPLIDTDSREDSHEI